MAHRLTFHHLCGAEVYGQSEPNRNNDLYHFVFYTTRKGGVPAVNCLQCGEAVTRASVRTTAEQYLADAAQDTLELALELARQSEEEETNAEENPPA